MAKRQNFDGVLTVEDAAYILGFLGFHEPVTGAVHNEEQIDRIECGRSMILDWCRHSLLRDTRATRALDIHDVANVLAFLNSQQYLRGCEYETENMEAATSMILGWCQRGLLEEINRDEREAITAVPEQTTALH